MKPLQVSVGQQGSLSLTIPEKSTENNFPSLFFPTELGFLFQGLLPHQVKIQLDSITAFLISGVRLKVIDLKFLLFLIHAILGYEHKILRYLFSSIILFSEVGLINYFM